MEVTRKSRRALRLQTWSFVVLFLTVVGLLAWLSTRYHYQADWTASGRHTLAPATVALLRELKEPVEVTAFARGNDTAPLRQRISSLLERYRKQKPDLTLSFVDPDLHPERVRGWGVSVDGELVIHYAGRRENLKTVGEQALTNALQRLARSGERRLVFLQGHGERRPGGEANHDLGEWVRQLQAKGFRHHTLHLGITPTVPEETAVLVIASPATDLLEGEVAILRDYLERGGNLLWLAEPGALRGLEPLADLLGVAMEPGTVVDPTGQLLGISNPAMVLVPDYPAHPVTEELTTITLFPMARALRVIEGAGWQSQPLLTTLERSWAETGALEGTIRFDEGADRAGPLVLGLALTRPRPGAEASEGGSLPMQRVAVIGDGDFLANTYLGNGANLELGNRLINWLSHDDAFIAIPPRTARDIRLELTPTLSALLGFGFLLVIPLALLGSGLTIWLKRRKR